MVGGGTFCDLSESGMGCEDNVDWFHGEMFLRSVGGCRSIVAGGALAHDPGICVRAVSRLRGQRVIAGPRLVACARAEHVVELVAAGPKCQESACREWRERRGFALSVSRVFPEG